MLIEKEHNGGCPIWIIKPYPFALQPNDVRLDPRVIEKVDENGNALHGNPSTKAKKKKVQADKNVVVLAAEKVEGHRSDIIHDVDKLIQYIGGDKDSSSASGKASKSNFHKSKQLHKQHASEDGARSKKQRAHSSKGKETRSELKKSNSLGEISTAKLEDFSFSNECDKDENKVILRTGKAQSERPKERRSWGTVEPPPFQILSSNASIENLETAENWVVTKPKKKNKKRRNSISSSRRQNSTSESFSKQHANRLPSPDLRGKSTCSVPHSDSSDADSVHSLPIDGLNVPISYADIAKNTEKPKEKKPSPEKQEKVAKEKIPNVKAESATKPAKKENLIGSMLINNVKVTSPEAKIVPDMNNPKNFPAMHFEGKAIRPDLNNVKIFPGDVPKNGPQLQLPPDVKNIKSFPAMPPSTIEASTKIFPSVLDAVTTNTKSVISLDFNNPKSFPAINSSKNLLVEKTNMKNNIVSGKVRNISPGNKNNGGGGIKSGNISSNNNLKAGVAVGTCRVQNNIQNDLSILHSNEKDSIQHNAQMLPPNIPDVQTIEKMHFLNRPVVVVAAAVVPSPGDSDADPTNVASSDTTPIQNNCDSSERSASKEGEEERPPPVIILSGLGNKEVPGLIFGFDVNEQLLNEDICESFVARWVAPESYTHQSHNHDKIVNFVGATWEAVINQTNGKVQYYKEES